ncbi:MAG: hypothetical protein ABIT38_04500 [Gemmatimonadaceae bacterium]
MSDERGFEPEKLAALLEGRLNDREREELLSHVAASDDMREVLGFAAEALEEEERVASNVASRDVVELPRGDVRKPSTNWRWMAAASIVLLAVGALAVRLRARDASHNESPVLALAEPTAGIPLGARDFPWQSTRGTGGSLSDEVRSARVGVLLSDLELAVRSADSSSTRYAAAIDALLEDVPASAPVRAMVRGLAQTSSRESGIEFEKTVDAVTALLSAPIVRLGRWGEAARVARIERDSAFFRSAPINVFDAALLAAFREGPLRVALSDAKRDYDVLNGTWERRAVVASTLLQAIVR